MKDLKPFLKEYIQKNLRKYYPSYYIKNSEILIKSYRRTLIATPYSDAQFLADILIENKNGKKVKKQIFIKKFKNAKNEFKNFQRIKEITYGRNKMAPYYFDLIEKENIILVEYIHPAKNLLYEFLKMNIPRKNQRETKKIITEIAKWLAFFQNKFVFASSPDMNNYLKQTEKELGTLPFFSDKEKKGLLNKIRKDSKIIKNLPKVFSADLYLRHILIVGNKLILVDWDNLKQTYNYYDIHALFINLESRTRHPIVFTRKYISELENEFLAVYKKLSKFNFSEAEYNVTRIMYLIHFLYSYNWRYKDKPLHTKKMPFWRYFMYNVKKEVSSYLNQKAK